MDGRADYRGIGEHLKQQLANNGSTPIELRTEHDPSSFYAKIGEAKESRPYGSFATQLWRFLTVYFIDRRYTVKLYFCYDKQVLQKSGGAGAGVDRDGRCMRVREKGGGGRHLRHAHRAHGGADSHPRAHAGEHAPAEKNAKGRKNARG